MNDKNLFGDTSSSNVYAIGIVRGSGKKRRIELQETYRPGLKQLDQFSHVIVLWWANKRDNAKHRSILQTKPPYAKTILTGVFATRAEYGPNPVAITTCRIAGIDEDMGVVDVTGLETSKGAGLDIGHPPE